MIEDLVGLTSPQVSNISIIERMTKEPLILRGEYCPEFLCHESLADIFEETALKFPQKTALIFQENSITYHELNLNSDLVAHYLISMGVKSGDLVGLWMPRGIDLLIMQVGIAKAGAGWLPFDADAPLERIKVCLDDAASSFLVLNSDWLEKAEYLNIQVFGHKELLKSTNTEKLRRSETNPESKAYVIYTSGSTGVPKGIPISQRNICHFLRSENALLSIREDDIVYQGFSVAFDMSFEEIWLSFLVGATLWIAPKEIISDPDALTTAIKKANITVLHTVPTLLSLFASPISTLRLVNLGGEACPQKLADTWATPERRVFNTYGPTETTVTACMTKVKAGEKVTIGKPLPNYGVVILAENDTPLPAGEVGELCIFGPGVAEGYLKRPELTDTKFILNPYAISKNESVLYRSGDLACIDTNGNIHCLGRVDDQVKIRGFRVELGEIEACLNAQPGVVNATVLLKKKDDVDILVAYIELEPLLKISVSNLRYALQSHLPHYMVPNHFEQLEHLPRLTSGKIDKKALAALPIYLNYAQSDTFEPMNEAETELFKCLKNLFPGQPLTREADFFNDLGGHSLLAAGLVSALRKNPLFTNVAVQFVYQNRTIGAMSAILHERANSYSAGTQTKKVAVPSRLRRIRCGLVQAMLIPPLVCLRMLHWLLPFFVYHYLADESLHSITLAASLSMLVFIFTQFFGFAVAITARFTLLAGIKPGHYPLWGIVYLRWWLFDRLADTAPLHLLSGSPLYANYLRLMGAKVGKNTNLGSLRLRFPTFVTIADEVSIGTSVNFENTRVERNELIIGTITVGKSSYVGSYSVIEGNTSIGSHSYLSGLSSLQDGKSIPAEEYWEGAPCRRVKAYTPPVRSSEKPKFMQLLFEKFIYSVGALLVACMFFFPIFPTFILVDYLDGIWFTASQAGHLLLSSFEYFLLALPASAILIGITILIAAGTRQLFLPRLNPGQYSVHSKAYYTKWLLNLIQETSLQMLHGLYATVYAPLWFRALGARIGKESEISNALGIVPDMLTLGDETFIADAVILGDEEIINGWMFLKSTVIGHRSFLGNGAYVAGGTIIPENVLIGVQSKPPTFSSVSQGETWMGSPALRLPARETFAGFPESLTFAPSKLRRFSRAIIETARIVLPLAVIISCAYLTVDLTIPTAEKQQWSKLLVYLSCAGLLYGLGCYLMVLMAKWIFIGRYKPTAVPMWTLFVWLSEAVTSLYEAIAVPNFLRYLRGTPWLPTALRLFGCRIGRDVYLDTTNVTEFDCVHIGSGSELNTWVGPQTHLFEDRIMKIGHVFIGSRVYMSARSTILYNGTVCDGARLGPRTLVLKGETIPENSSWIGTPAEPGN